MKTGLILTVFLVQIVVSQAFPSLRISRESEDDEDDNDVLTPEEAEEEKLIARDLMNLLAETMDKLHEPDVAKRRLSFSRSNAWNKIPPRIMMLRGRRVRNYLPPAPRAFWQNV